MDLRHISLLQRQLTEALQDTTRAEALEQGLTRFGPNKKLEELRERYISRAARYVNAAKNTVDEHE